MLTLQTQYVIEGCVREVHTSLSGYYYWLLSIPIIVNERRKTRGPAE